MLLQQFIAVLVLAGLVYCIKVLHIIFFGALLRSESTYGQAVHLRSPNYQVPGTRVTPTSFFGTIPSQVAGYST